MEPMVAATPAQHEQPGPRAIAPAWHTAVVLLVLFGLSALSAYQHGLISIGRTGGRAASYVLVMAVEWVLTGFIWFGIRRRGIRLSELVGGSWPSARAVLRDLGITVLYLIAANLVLSGLGFLLKVTPSPGLRNIFPNGPTEVVLFLMLAFTAGICEEILFRGYLQRQFAALTRSTAAGMMLQGVAFGLAHGYQGRKYMCIIAVYGCLFGLLAYWRRSLRPGMTAHFVQDALGGMAGRYFMK
jgi:membrane protease YdiL (CAAX protease family)